MCRTGGNQHKLHQAKLQNKNNVRKKGPSDYTIIVNHLEEEISRLQTDNSGLQAKNKELIKQNTNMCNELDKLK